MPTITFKGITQNSSISTPISDELFNSIEADYYKKPAIDDVITEMKNIHHGGTRVGNIYNYFIKEVASKAIGPGASWSIWDGIHNREIMEYFAGKFAASPQFYPDSYTFVHNLDNAFRLCGVRYCVKCPNYPMKSVQGILKKYNVNNVWYDFSCGWGTRLLGSLQAGIEYYGTDPNYELTPQLEAIAKLYKEVNHIGTKTHIYTLGSENFIPEMEGKIGLAFSSPPYFDLEDYQIGDQSYKEGTQYEAWLEVYMRGTIKNIYRYLIDDGFFAINVKNFKANHNIPNRDNRYHYLEEDVVRIAEECGFKLYETEGLKNIQRCHGDRKNTTEVKDDKAMFINGDEKIFVFKKNIPEAFEKKEEKVIKEISLW